MNLLFSYLAQPAADRRLLRQAFLLVAFTRLRLWARPLSQAERALLTAEGIHTNSSSSDTTVAAHAARAVRSVSRLVPGATCLTQALALNKLLAHAGVGSTVRIGVKKNDTGAFAAHAWVLVNNRVVIGGNVASYVPLVDMSGRGA